MIGLFIIRQKDNNMIGWLFWISMQETYTYLRAVLQLAPAGPHRTNRHRPCRRRGPWPPPDSSKLPPPVRCVIRGLPAPRGDGQVGPARHPQAADSSAWALRRSCLFVCFVSVGSGSRPDLERCSSAHQRAASSQPGRGVENLLRLHDAQEEELTICYGYMTQ